MRSAVLSLEPFSPSTRRTAGAANTSLARVRTSEAALLPRVGPPEPRSSHVAARARTRSCHLTLSEEGWEGDEGDDAGSLRQQKERYSVRTYGSPPAARIVGDAGSAPAGGVPGPREIEV